MAPKFVKKLLVILHLRKPEIEKYDYDAHMHLEAQGFYNEGLEGIYKCPQPRCKNTISVYRQVRRQTTHFHDILRFEQTVPVHASSKLKPASKTTHLKPTLPGKASVSVPVVWNGENRKPVSEKEYIGQKKTVDGKTYTLAKHRFFASVQCVACKKDMHLWDELRKYEGEEEMRWFLARKEGNPGLKDVEGGGSDAETLVDV
ncbi:uncharacterized protein LY89DRAFT_684858 [Mollisia scopiformis]|uniref:Uncharacterized protein n=1 Tax=Mollisia scopiformis TaxID=149040 RepID=A0A194X9G8_MOLSC|nr:uncharacterized protein LY89DRAFT_684858 [Mollisia scopiformis]KUJ16820.1 hypothetical protein LY89DRAFT_684858 [Mollisia scopiformis]